MWFFKNYHYIVLIFTLMTMNRSIIESCLPSSLTNAMNQTAKGVVIMRGSYNGTPIVGMIKFTQDNMFSPVVVNVNISGLPTGQGNFKHGLHIHLYGTNVISDDVVAYCGSAGPHFNPFNLTHGDRLASIRHVGDYGNVISDNNGMIITNFKDNVTSLYGPLSIIGRNIVLHQLEDDLGLQNNTGSKTIGNSGSRIACGIIGIGNF